MRRMGAELSVHVRMVKVSNDLRRVVKWHQFARLKSQTRSKVSRQIAPLASVDNQLSEIAEIESVYHVNSRMKYFMVEANQSYEKYIY